VVLRRRLIFATPFVFVVGCKRPVESPPDPRPPVVDVVAAPEDATVTQHHVDANAQLFADMCASPGANCNPPIPIRDAKPEPKLQGRVLLVKPGKGAQKSIVTISIGARDGVLASWRGTLVEGVRTLGSFTILDVTEATTTGYTEAPKERITGDSQVHFPPPDAK
jgi:hypothetical protein